MRKTTAPSLTCWPASCNRSIGMLRWDRHNESSNLVSAVVWKLMMHVQGASKGGSKISDDVKMLHLWRTSAKVSCSDRSRRATCRMHNDSSAMIGLGNAHLPICQQFMPGRKNQWPPTVQGMLTNWSSACNVLKKSSTHKRPTATILQLQASCNVNMQAKFGIV